MLRKLSIKGKVAIWFALLMLFLSAAVLAFLLLVGEREVISLTKHDLMTTVADSRSAIEFENGVLDFDDDIKYFLNGVTLSVYNEKKQLLYGRSPYGFAVDTPFTHNLVREIDSKWYVYDLCYQQDGYGVIWMRGVLLAEGAHSIFTLLLKIAFILLPVLVLLAAGGAYFIARKAFQPIREITDTAKQISRDSNLERRIDLGPGKDEVYTLAATFDEMFNSLETAFKKEKQFTSDVSHELRTPTSVIISECECALESTNLSKEARESFEHILKEAKGIAELTGHLLTFARADRGESELYFEPVNISVLFETIFEQLSEMYPNIGIRQDIAPGLFVSGDESMLMRLIWNLAENAIKYGKPNGSISLKLYAEGGNVIAALTDDGIGIAPEHIDKIFNRFYRVDASRAKKGYGLGLPLCRLIADMHSGSINVQSEPGCGSTFTFSLPQIKS